MITKVRERKSTEVGPGDTCHCGAPFLFVAEKDDKTISFYWCSRCDVLVRK